jgi:hypothetical protein
MRTARLLLASLLLTGSLGAINSVIAADSDGYIEKVPLSVGNYCHEKFPAIEQQTLGTNDPTLRNDQDVIDYYGPCDEKPTGKDQQHQQQVEEENRWQQNSSDF